MTSAADSIVSQYRKGRKLRPFAFDCETYLIRPGSPFPEMVCYSYADQETPEGAVLEPAAGVEHFRKVLLDPDVLIIGANTAFDLGVMGAADRSLIPLIFQALRDNRVVDVQIRQKLLDIANGEYRGKSVTGSNGKPRWIQYNYALADLTRRHLGRDLGKTKGSNGHTEYTGDARWRLFYKVLARIPMGEWPVESLRYSAVDSVVTLGCFETQEAVADADADDVLADQYRQQRKAWALALTSAWGLRTDLAAVDAFEGETAEEIERLRQMLVDAGLVRPDRKKRNGTIEKGARDTKAAKALMVRVCEEMGLEPRLTDTGEICLDAEACEATGDPLLKLYADFSGLNAVGSKDVPMLRKGVWYPIHTRFDMAATGRTTSSGPNVQNIRRFPGIRECFRPRRGFVFFQSDYSSLELHTLAQACLTLLGRSALADALNAGIDPHTKFACSLLGITYEQGLALKKSKDRTFDNARQTAKVANFGFPGGLGADSLVAYAWATYKVRLTVEEARRLKANWLIEWPEMRDYFAFVNANECVLQIGSGRIRAGASYTARCNGYFQGLGADATGDAAWEICWHQYMEPTSPLYGTHCVNYVHDEFIGECRDDARAHDVAMELSRVMVMAANRWTPDVPCRTEPCLMAYWSKDAATVKGEDGRLEVWGRAA